MELFGDIESHRPSWSTSAHFLPALHYADRDCILCNTMFLVYIAGKEEPP